MIFFLHVTIYFCYSPVPSKAFLNLATIAWQLKLPLIRPFSYRNFVKEIVLTRHAILDGDIGRKE